MKSYKVKRINDILKILSGLLISLLLFAAMYIMVNRHGFAPTIFLILGLIISIDFINTNYLRHKGKYPPKGQVTIDDVVRFVSEGKTILALRAYRELHNCGIIHAEKAIQEIRKEILDQKLEEKGSQSK